MSEELTKQFGVSVSQALTVFQVIEETLKLYITFSFRLIRVRLDKSIPFNFNGKDYENAALETLIKVFSKLTENEELIKMLNKVTSNRNYVAHQAMAKYLHKLEEPENHDEHEQKINDISKEAWVCFAMLQQDLAKLDERIMGKKS